MAKLKFGEEVSASELSFVRNKIRNPDVNSDIYNLARAFALSNDPTEENVSELLKFWNDDIDDYSRSGVIAAICGPNGWALASDYLDKLLLEADPENWFNSDSSVSSCLSALGSYLQKIQDKKVYKNLLDAIIRVSINVDLKSELEYYLVSVIRAVDEGIRGRDAFVSPKNYIENDAELQNLLNEVRRRISL